MTDDRAKRIRKRRRRTKLPTGAELLARLERRRVIDEIEAGRLTAFAILAGFVLVLARWRYVEWPNQNFARATKWPPACH